MNSRKNFKEPRLFEFLMKFQKRLILKFNLESFSKMLSHFIFIDFFVEIFCFFIVFFHFCKATITFAVVQYIIRQVTHIFIAFNIDCELLRFAELNLFFHFSFEHLGESRRWLFMWMSRLVHSAMVIRNRVLILGFFKFLTVCGCHCALIEINCGVMRLGLQDNSITILDFAKSLRRLITACLDAVCTNIWPYKEQIKLPPEVIDFANVRRLLSNRVGLHLRMFLVFDLV